MLVTDKSLLEGEPGGVEMLRCLEQVRRDHCCTWSLLRIVTRPSGFAVRANTERDGGGDVLCVIEQASQLADELAEFGVVVAIGDLIDIEVRQPASSVCNGGAVVAVGVERGARCVVHTQ